MEKRLQMTAENLQAIREGRKTQTRRVIKPQPISVGEFEKGSPFYWEAPYKTGCAETGLWYRDDKGLKFHCKSPYQVGDECWLPETWCLGDDLSGHEAIYYKSDAPDGEYIWKSPRFMPKEYAREWVRIKSVRVERLQEITAMDIEAEGILNENTELSKALELWIKLWDSRNPKYLWSSNPYVWGYEFERIER